TFWTWLNGQLASYIGENTVRVASILEPAIVTLGTVYVMIWGYLQLTGSIEEPFVAGVKRIVTLAVILGVALHLWLYNTLLVDTFYRAPTEFAAAVVGASDPVRTIDAIWNTGGAVADQLFRDGTGGGFWGAAGGMLAGIAIWLLIGLLCVYTMFLLALSSVSEAVLLALGPLFIVTLLFDSTRRFFEAWLAQLANYAMITILTVMVAALMLHLVASYAQQTAALGTGMKIVDALNMLLVTGLVILFMRQVMPVASGLAGGVTLASFGVAGRAAGWVGSRAAGATGTVGALAGGVIAGKFVDFAGYIRRPRRNGRTVSSVPAATDDSFDRSG
ncbi:MAG: type IV secretion system protein, partial [Gammaproteobacteria bacterium]|nr:type IV secretion system protein [Gammaproteobacteria bacterium]